MRSSRIDQAVEMAARWHHGERRDGDSALPYFTHPIEVLIQLRHIGQVTDEELWCAAVLHDVLEDSDATQEEIEFVAGQRVLDLVVELTRREPTEEERLTKSKDEIRKIRSDWLLEEISRMSRDAQTIKLADRLTNFREGTRSRTTEKMIRYAGQTKKILEIIPRTVNPPLWEALAQEVARWESDQGRKSTSTHSDK
jgi:GTP diphosphokinase / guanosine-3',5'-bis(diphosphate) 3'-diphosphatase